MPARGASSSSHCDRFEAYGTVAAVDADGLVELEFDLGSCAGCRGACMWRRAMTQRLRFRSGERLAVGDEVSLSLPARGVLAGSWWLHGLPLGALLIGAAGGAAFAGHDAGTLIGSLVGVGVALLAAPRIARRAEAAALADARIERADRAKAAAPADARVERRRGLR